MAASAGCAAVSIAMTACAPNWPRWMAVLCWLPALALMAMRFDPRPEIFSLVYLAGFLAVLMRAERHPKLVWCLPFFQVLWVNTHGLFVLGPIVLGCFLIDRATRAWIGPKTHVSELTHEPQGVWQHLLFVSAAVAIACLTNPYGVRGALFPLELFPKIYDPANPYKAYVDEFSSLQSVVSDRMRGATGAHPHVRTQIFLLLALPWSFVLPAAWENWNSSLRGDVSVRASGSTGWVVGLIIASILVLVAALGVPLSGTARSLVGISGAAPAVMLMLSIGAAVPLAGRSRLAASTLVAGSAATAVWTAWLSAYLFNDGATRFGMSTGMLACLGGGLGALSVPIIVRAGSSTFRLLLVATFTYLGFQAIRNINLFGLVIGAVHRFRNVSEWIAKLQGGRPQPILEWLAPAVVAAVVALWAVGVVTDRYYIVMGDVFRSGLRERPLTRLD